ncbi:MAG: hypothetical protein AAF250_10025 [Pseudomonadota bacterium]
MPPPLARHRLKKAPPTLIPPPSLLALVHAVPLVAAPLPVKVRAVLLAAVPLLAKALAVPLHAVLLAAAPHRATLHKLTA